MSDEPAILDDSLYHAVDDRLAGGGPLAAVDALAERLRKSGDWQSLFYALLMRKRVELGVSPFPLGAAADLPAETHQEYEDAIRLAARHVGGLYLEKGDIAKAWPFYRMLGEPEAFKAALVGYSPGPEDDIYPLVDIAWQQGVAPERGFDWILERSGVCSAITMVQSSDFRSNPTTRDHCVRKLVRALHAQLTERLAHDLTQRGSPPAPGTTIAQILAANPDLLAEEWYHVDVSHLSSVCQLALTLPAGPEAELALDLCAYGQRLAPALRGEGGGYGNGATYADAEAGLNIVTGRDVSGGLNHFEQKLADVVALDPEDARGPAETLVNMHLKAGRPADALRVARAYLADAPDGSTDCPSLAELARLTGDYAGLTEVAKAHRDPVTYLASRIAATLPRVGTEVAAPTGPETPRGA